jgi:hypothetical protein
MGIAAAAAAVLVSIFYEFKVDVIIGSYDKKYEEISKLQQYQISEMKAFKQRQVQDTDTCLKREKKLATQLWILRKTKRKDYEQMLAFNKKRFKLWQEKKKLEHQLKSYKHYESTGILERSPIESKLEFLILSEAIGGDSQESKLKQSAKFPSMEWFLLKDRTHLIGHK